MTWRAAAIAVVAFVATPALAGPPASTVVKVNPVVQVTAPEAARPQAQKRISLNYRGPLREAVKRIADDGKLNVVVRNGGSLDEEGEFHFENVPALEALTTLASAYNLTLEQHGSVFTLRPLSGPEQAVRMQHELATLQRTPRPSMGPVPPIPPVPPVPALAPRAAGSDDEDESDSDADEAAQDAREAEREAHQAEREAHRAEAEARREEMRERVREMRERLRGLHRSSGSSGCKVSTTGNYTVEEGAEVCEVSVLGGNLEILGHVTGDVAVFGGNVHLGPDAEVDGDVVSFGGEVTKEDGAEIHGEQLSLDGSSARMAAKGASTWKNLAKARSERASDSGLSWRLPNLLLQFAVFFGLSFLFLMFAPARMKLIEGELKRDPVKCGVAGLLGGIALLPMTVFLAVTIIGIPFALVLWLVVALGTAMGFSAVAAEIGTRLPVLKPNRKTQAAVLALGIGVLLLVELIPVLGKVVLFVVACLALGAIIRTRFGGKTQGFPEPI